MKLKGTLLLLIIVPRIVGLLVTLILSIAFLFTFYPDWYSNCHLVIL